MEGEVQAFPERVFPSMTRPFTTIHTGIQAAIKRRTLQPLIRSIELVLATSRKSAKSDVNTIFSCDSFCQPHLERQIMLYKALDRIHARRPSFINLPISHYITSVPDARLLELVDQPLKLLEINNQLLDHQNDQLQGIPNESRINTNTPNNRVIAHAYEKLIEILDPSSWNIIPIDGFPFHELAYRDLCLTYKCTADLTRDNDQPFYHHFIQSSKFNLFLLCLLACEESIGSTCFGMSFYTATTVLLFYCQKTLRTFRFFDGPALNLSDFGLCSDTYMRITESPVSATRLTEPSAVSELSKIQLSPKTLNNVISLIESRFSGTGSHTYSTGIEETSAAMSPHASWIEEQRRRGRQIIALYTSSHDEMVGLQYSFRHFDSDLSHLSTSVFKDQECWIEKVIRYFSSKNNTASVIIRLHPRLAEDKRGLPESPLLPSLMARLNNFIGDVSCIRLVHPADPISSYWIGLQADLILNGWSTIGLEFAIKGKVVTNAFYKCTLGASALYPVHARTRPLKNQAEYFERVERLLSGIRNNLQLDEVDYVSAEEATRAFFVAFTAGLIDLSNSSQLHAQLASPVVLTSEMISFLCGDYNYPCK